MAIRNFKSRDTTDFIIVHTTGNEDDIGAHEIRRQHLAKGWLDIGYHFVIRRDGMVETGRIPTAPSGFTPQPSVALCLCGSEEITDAQAISLRSLLTELINEYPSAEILPRCSITNFNFNQGELSNVHTDNACPVPTTTRNPGETPD